MSEKKYFFKVFKGLIAFLFVLGVVMSMIVPIASNGIGIEIISNKGKYFFKMGAEIERDKTTFFKIPDEQELKIEAIRLYGTFNSMYIVELDHHQVTDFIESVEEGEKQWYSDYVVVTGKDGIKINMTEAFQEEMKKQSGVKLQDRLLLIECCFIICSCLMIVCKLLEEKVSGDNHGPIYEVKKFINDLKKYGRYMIYAAKTDLKAEVANSYLNRLWWLLEPLFSMIVYVIVFGQVLGKSVDNYAIFLFSTLLMWNFFSKTVNYSVKLVRNNKEIISKVYVPKFILLLSNMMLNLFKLFFSMIVLIVMFVFFRVDIGVNIIWVFPAYVGLILLTFGLGMIFLHFGVYIDDLSYAVGILLNMLMYLSGMFYEVMTTLPEPLNVLVMCLNPIALYLSTMRNALLYNSVTNVPFLIVWLVISLILCCVGVHIVYKNENGYVKVV